MSHQGYSPYQHYVPPAQPQYAQEQQQQQFDGDGYQQQYASYNARPPMAASHATTGASYTTVSSLGTGTSPGVVNYHVSGMGVNHAAGASAYGQSMPEHGTHNLPELGVQEHRPTVRSDTVPVFEMSAEPAQHAPERPAQQENIRRNDTAGQTPVQANPWPFYLDVSPTEAKKSDRVAEKESEDKSKQEEKEPLQAFPWPYHGPPTEEDEPQATVHPPKKDTSTREKSTGSEAAKDTSGDRPLPLLKDNHLDKPLPPTGNDESVLDDILADMDAQDEDDELEEAPVVMEAAEAQRPAKDPTLRPPPLNLSRPQPGDATKPKVGSGAVSPGGRTC
ncbi:hypothetical protein NLU13_0343 [Sarocladium strictum]|uniref:Uncharacterized protein n=1 Tax=Sarocladium strictum TaxID=5046 RepID=A0AA39GNW0_SARSR|nr:hypothetical protein NLU13_0343 [Sarocladium strictum]